MNSIGRSIPRVDALAKVTGKALFPGDINRPGQVSMVIKFSDRPHARITRIDTRSAEALPGVLLVLTASDVPRNEYGLIMFDQPVLCGPGSDKPYADRVRFVGDQVVAVVAESEVIAEQAVDLVQVEYQDLPVITDPREAMKPNATLLHPERSSNVFHQYKVRKGDVEAGFKQADVVIDGHYYTPAQEHAFLQPEAGVAYLDGRGRVTVEVAGQWTHEDREQIAHALQIPADQVRVIYPAIGGAFGGREDMSVQIVLALAVKRLEEKGIKRPVKIIWSREESIRGHHKRHPFFIHSRWGATRDGKVVAAEAEVIQDGGAYAYTSTKVLGNATLMCMGPYAIPNAKVDAYSVYTNHIPGGAFRGFGGPQGAFAAESQITKLAQELGIDPVEIRMRNLLGEDDPLIVQSPLPQGVTIAQVVEHCAKASGWEKRDSGWGRPGSGSLGQPAAPHLKRGIGFACGFKNVGFSFGAPEKCVATVELYGQAHIERVVLRHAGADVGQGSHTVFTQMAAEALGVSVELVELDASDSATAGDSGSASASRMTFMAGNAIRGAAEQALQRWNDEDRPAEATFTYRPPATTMFDPETGACDPNFAYGYVAETATVEVDTETGQVRVLDVVCADDVGKAINPQQVIGQIEGGVVQAVGYSVMEDFQQDGGHVQTEHLSTYLIPGVLDVPERVNSLVLELSDPEGPWGVRGMAEMPFLPLAAAIAAAIQDAVGVWYDQFPYTPERVLRGVRKAEPG